MAICPADVYLIGVDQENCFNFRSRPKLPLTGNFISSVVRVCFVAVNFEE